MRRQALLFRQCMELGIDEKETTVNSAAICSVPPTANLPITGKVAHSPNKLVNKCLQSSKSIEIDEQTPYQNHHCILYT